MLSGCQELEKQWRDYGQHTEALGAQKALCVMRRDGYTSLYVCPTQRTSITRYSLRTLGDYDASVLVLDYNGVALRWGCPGNRGGLAFVEGGRR